MEKFTIEEFNNTEVAFKSKSDWRLKKAQWLFTIVKNPAMSKIMTTLARLFPIKPAIKATVFDHFCGGETISESESTIKTLAKFNVQTVLDYSVEGSNDEKNFDEVTEEVLRTIENAEKHNNIPFAVYKVSGIAPVDIFEKVQLGQGLSEEEQGLYDRGIARMNRLSKAAFNHHVPIFIDSEDSWYQDVIDRVSYDDMAKYNVKEAIVYNTFQMYRKDGLENLIKAIDKAREKGYFFGAKLVRGAYMEKERERAEEKGYPDPICVDKDATDTSYNEGLKVCVENCDIVAVANCSHNEYSNYYLTELMEQKGLERNDTRFFFAQLFGMSDNISFNLAENGYNIGKYVPYGPVKRVMPYLIRRAEENTSVAGQSTRELLLIKTEVARRKG